MSEDRRPDPKPRKLGQLWQVHKWYEQLAKIRIVEIQRSDAAERGKTNTVSPQFEADMLERLKIEENLKWLEKELAKAGSTAGPIWDWLTSIRGLGTGFLAARLLAQIDCIGPTSDRPDNFSYVSKLWRFAGLAVIDGKAEKGTAHYNRRLKALLLGPKQIVDQFVTQRTPIYRDLYDGEKERLRRQHPDPLCNKCDAVAVQKGQSWKCPTGCKVDSGFAVRYTPLHIDKMARRKVAKVFLQHLWVTWRGFEGLPITEPWILREGSGHNRYIAPPE